MTAESARSRSFTTAPVWSTAYSVFALASATKRFPLPGWYARPRSSTPSRPCREIDSTLPAGETLTTSSVAASSTYIVPSGPYVVPAGTTPESAAAAPSPDPRIGVPSPSDTWRPFCSTVTRSDRGSKATVAASAATSATRSPRACSSAVKRAVNVPAARSRPVTTKTSRSASHATPVGRLTPNSWVRIDLTKRAGATLPASPVPGAEPAAPAPVQAPGQVVATAKVVSTATAALLRFLYLIVSYPPWATGTLRCGSS